MKLERAGLGYIQRWWYKLIMLVTILKRRGFANAIATLAIVLTFSSFHLNSVTAQTTPQPSTIAIPRAVAPVVISGKTFKIATRLVSPFVTESNGELGGFSIELWKNIAQELGAKSIFVKNGNVSELFNSVESGQADVGISAISVTSQREQDFDFSQPIFDSGLQILVRSQGSQSSISRLVDSLFTPEFLQLLGMMFLIVLVPAHIIWLLERNHQGGFLENSAYFPGIFKACWWAAATLATQAEEMPKSPVGRVMAVIWMFISVVFIAYFTATVTTSLTVDRLQSNIKSPQDLVGKRVATIVNTTSANYLSQQKIATTEFKQIDEAFNALNSSNVDAVVYDAPILLYYAAHDGKGKVQVVGNIFRKESYAIALPNGSPYRKPINNALLSLQENGKYQEIYDKWFSTK